MSETNTLGHDRLADDADAVHAFGMVAHNPKEAAAVRDAGAAMPDDIAVYLMEGGLVSERPVQAEMNEAAQALRRAGGDIYEVYVRAPRQPLPADQLAPYVNSVKAHFKAEADAALAKRQNFAERFARAASGLRHRGQDLWQKI